MNLSFQEKTLWLMLASLLAIFGSYFASVVPPRTADVLPDQIGQFVGLVVLFVVIQILGSIVLALFDRRQEADERDRLIELKGTRNGSHVLAAGVVMAVCLAPVTKGNFLFTHLLLAFWVLADLVDIGSRLFYYRRDA